MSGRAYLHEVLQTPGRDALDVQAGLAEAVLHDGEGGAEDSQEEEHQDCQRVQRVQVPRGLEGVRGHVPEGQHLPAIFQKKIP